MKMSWTTLFLAVIFLVALLSLAVFAQSKRKKKQVAVIGAERAAAAAAEERRKARGDAGESPMPAGQYEFSRDELGLVNPKPNALDSALAELSRRYARSDAPTRARMRRAISMEEFYRLLGFAGRAAVFGLRERSAERLADGLSAVAMVEEERVDFRDVLMSISLLHHSAERIGASPEKLFRDAAALAEPGTARLILDFLKRPAKEKDLRASWGRDEVEAEGGVGFISRDIERYEPTYDLKKVAVDVARLVAADEYRPVWPTIASKLWPVWLETRDREDNAALHRALQKVRAGASVSGHLAPTAHPDASSQQLTIFLVELEDEAAARTLLGAAERKKPEHFSMLALAEGRLFCLLVARSFTVGVESFETPESVRRFSAGLTEILRRHVQG